MLEMHSSIPPTLPFPVSFGCLGQPNYIVHVKICAFKSVPSHWNVSQYATTNEHKNTFFCFVLHMNLIFKYIYNVLVVCLFSFPYFLYQKDVCEQSSRCWALWN